MPDDKLIAATLQEAEQHRDYFRQLTIDNEAIRADLHSRIEDIARREQAATVREETIANTSASQDRKAGELSDRELAVTSAETALDERSADLDARSAAFDDAAKGRSADLDARERLVESREVTLQRERAMFEDLVATTRKAQQEQRDQLTAREERLRSDSLAFQAEREDFKTKVREEVVAELLKNAPK